MKEIFIITGQQSITLKEIGEMLGVELVFGTTVDGGQYCNLGWIEVMVGTSGLLGETGFGTTRQDAMRDYATSLGGKRIVHRAYCDDRTELQLPDLVLAEEGPESYADKLRRLAAMLDEDYQRNRLEVLGRLADVANKLDS